MTISTVPVGADILRLFDISPNAYVVLDRDLTIVSANRAYLGATMRELTSLLGRNMFDAFPSDPQSISGRLLRDSFAKVLATGTADYLPVIPYAVATADGQMQEHVWSATHTPLLDEAGQVAYILQHTVDVTGLQGNARPDQSASVLGRAEKITVKNLELDSERQYLRGLFEQAPSFMAVLDGPNHVFSITNAAYMQLIGHRDVLGKTVREALPEIADQGFLELLDGVYTTGQAFIGHALTAYLQRSPNGPLEERYLDLIYQPVLGSDGRPKGIFVQGHDITDQKKAELAAAASERQFRQLAQSIPNHVWTALPDGNLNWFNDQVYAYSGATPGTLEGAQWASIVHPDDVAIAAGNWADALKTTVPYKAEFRIRRFDGVFRWHIARATPVMTDEGVVGHWVGTNTDIEEQKLAELALRESELQVKVALAAAEMGVWQCMIVDGKFKDLSGDARALSLLGGHPGESAAFEEFVERIHPEDRGLLAPAVERALGENGYGVLDVEYRVVAGVDRPERWVHARAQATQAADGMRLIGTVRDISERKDAELRQAMLSGELQHRIKNTLAMVSAIATQTLRGEDVADRRESFSARLQALAQAHSDMMGNKWNRTLVRSVVEGALLPHRANDQQFVLNGPEIELSPKQALSMALTVHELATNAVKYGALSVDGGRVEITWSDSHLDESGNRLFSFQWEEKGGPMVTEPTVKGFGSKLINRVLAGDFQGKVSMSYRPEGVICVLESPAENVGVGDAAPLALQ